MLRDKTLLGAILSAWNFDPTEDHPTGFDFTDVSALVNDFREINDDLDTIEGLRGDHFNTLLEWQSRVNPRTTALLAWVQPGPLCEVAFRDPESAPRLAEILSKHGYDAIVLSGVREDELEIDILTRFASGLQRGAAIPVAVAYSQQRNLLKPPFSMQFWTTSLAELLGAEPSHAQTLQFEERTGP